VAFLYPILLFFVQGYNEVYVVDSARNIGTMRGWSSYELVGYIVDFSIACSVLKCQLGVLSLSFINFISKSLSNSLELTL